MPISTPENQKPVMDLLRKIGAKNILDLGVGYGRFAPMIKTQIANSHVFGIEIYEPYFDKIPKNCYNRLYNDDIRTFDYEKMLFSNVDIHAVMMIDVLEHLERPEGIKLLQKLEKLSPFMIVSVPIVDCPQGEFLGNIHETHRAQWKIKELEDLGYKLFYEGKFIGVFYKDLKMGNNTISYTDVQGWFNNQGEQVYMEMIDKYGDDSHFVEIGCFMGRSTTCMAQGIKRKNKKIKFDAIDHFKGSAEHQTMLKGKSLFETFKWNIDHAGVSDIVNPIKMDSLSAVELYENESLDFVFIDASHDYDSVVKDINAWLPKVKNYGILAGDVYNEKHPGVMKAVDELLGKNIRKTGHYWLYWKVIK